jgi:hypothetical protein
MHNFNLQLSGSTGSGKTSFVKYLLSKTPRYFVFDPFAEYNGLKAWYSSKFEQTAEHLLRNHSAKNYRVVFQGDSDAIWESLGESDDQILDEFRAVLRQLLYTMHYYKAPPLGLVLEESHFYVMPDSRREPWPEIRSLYRFAGRRSSISSINIVQSHTDIAPEVRQGAATYVAMRNTDPPVSLVRQFGDDLAALKPFQPGAIPKPGTHYLTIPSNIDVIETWFQTMAGNHVLIRTDGGSDQGNASGDNGSKSDSENGTGSADGDLADAESVNPNSPESQIHSDDSNSDSDQGSKTVV